PWWGLLWLGGAGPPHAGRGWRRGWLGLKLLVDVLEAQAAGQHHDLEVVEELRDLFGGPIVRLVFGGYPDLGGFLDDLLADGMDTGIELRDGPGPLCAGACRLGQLGEQLFEGLHGLSP